MVFTYEKPKFLKKLSEALEAIGIPVKIYKVEKVLLRGKDVTKFIKGKYSPERNEIILTPYADKHTLVHELAHALVEYYNPGIYEEVAQLPPKKRTEMGIKIEKMVKKYEDEAREILEEAEELISPEE